MSLYGYPREPEPSADEEYFVAPPVPEPVPSPPAPLLPADPPGFAPMPPSYPNGHGGYANGEAVPGQRGVPETEFMPPHEPTGLHSDPSGRGGWQEVTARPGEAPAERGWHDLVTRPSDPGTARHRTGSGDAVELGTEDDAAGFRWLADRPAESAPAFGPSPQVGLPMIDRPGFGTSPSMGQPAIDRPGFGPSPGMGQPAVPFAAPDVRSVPTTPVEPPTRPPAPAPRRAVTSPDRTGTQASAMRSPSARTGPSEAAIAALLDEPDVVPWDRRPLMIVIATAVVLVLIGVATAFVTAWMVGPAPAPSWHENAPLSGAPGQPGS